MSREGKRKSSPQPLKRLWRKDPSSSRPTSPIEVQPAKPRVEDVTGLTLFGDLPRSLRNLTPERVDSIDAEPAQVPGAFKVRLARGRAATKQAATLIERGYAWRGYQIPGLKADPNLRTFVTYANGLPVGTLSLRVDSPMGLSADDLYKDELVQLRATRGRLCEFTRLAVVGDTVSKPVLGALFHTAVLYGQVVRDCEYAVIEVNPRHAAFYRRTLFFELVGPERMNQHVNAPAVLLCLSLQRLAEELANYFSNAEKPGAGRSFFAHWYAPAEAAGVLNRLRQLQS